jgi:hypothetical protein
MELSSGLLLIGGAITLAVVVAILVVVAMNWKR